ncbi:DUF368 domain-containing protein [Bacillus sp. FJAT-45037]|uniref:DUF368 domain-containing protein n=1 Tax=Bacillus sp. FJAT-45037 TaxID=2011007 RepID=UPI001E62EEB4|nr:DUF368 domain-containing protein [Bacillus sp. FJAT-45037]
MFRWRNIFKGMAMGISDIIPGVSGGTIALVLGIYHSLIAAINGLFSKNWREHILFLIPVGLGILLALVSVSHTIEWLLVEYPEPLFYFFLGLIIGVVPFLLKDINYKQTFQPYHYVVLLIGAILVGSTYFITSDELANVMTQLTWSDYAFLFIAGWLASSAMILPGVSGSFVLLLIGVYPTVIHALSNMVIPIIIVVGIGVLVGILTTSRLITVLFQNHKISTYALIIGFILGSTIVIFPGIPDQPVLVIISLLSFILGGASVSTLSSFSIKKELAK